MAHQTDVENILNPLRMIFNDLQNTPIEEVLNSYKEFLLEEHTVNHIAMFFNIIGEDADLYAQEATTLLKKSQKMPPYVEKAIKHLPKTVKEYSVVTENALTAVYCTMKEEIPLVVSLTVIRKVLKYLKEPIIGDFDNNNPVIKLICVITHETPNHKSNWPAKLSRAICLPTYVSKPKALRTWILSFRLSEDLYTFDYVPVIMKSFGVTSVPEEILDTASMEMDEKLNEKWRKYFETNYNSRAQPLPSTTEVSKPLKWHKTSKRWSSKFEMLTNMSASVVYKLGGVNFVVDTDFSDFRIAKGSDGTEVFLGLRDDGTEVAVKRMLKSNSKTLENEAQLLRLLQLYDANIVRYVDFLEDKNFVYLILQLCEYTLKEYITEGFWEKINHDLKQIVFEVLYSLRAFHSKNILHRDIKPQNILIDVTPKARFSDFGISRQLASGQTTHATSGAGTSCWKAKETLEESNVQYKMSTDIQVAGMLVYYILSGGQHPFGKGPGCEVNILKGEYNLEHVEDEVAKDLIECMINKDPEKRPTVEETMAHPYFWSKKRRVEYLEIMGNVKEACICRMLEEEFLRAVDESTKGRSFYNWRSKLPQKFMNEMNDKKKPYPDNTLGLLRFTRNFHVHKAEHLDQFDVTLTFPDLFGWVYTFAKARDWNSRPAVKKNLKGVYSSTRESFF